MKKFTKQFLSEVLQFTEDEVKLIMEVQRKFPEVLVNEGEFIDSTRHLYLELGLNESNYSRWINKYIIKNEFFKEETDWFKFTLQTDECSNNGHYANDYKITLDFAKHLSMMQRTENSHKVRNYFILMDKAIKGQQEHILIREPEAKGYNDMKAYVNKWCELNGFDNSDDSLTKREANLLNIALTGKSAMELRDYIGYKDIQTREHLTIEKNKALSELQLINSSLLMANLDFVTRKQIIEDTCKNKYSHLKIVK